MNKHQVLTLIILATMGGSTLAEAPVQALAKSTKHASKVTHPKRYKIGKRTYTLKQMRTKYHLHYRKTVEKKPNDIVSIYNNFDGKLNYANSGTFNMLTGKNHSKFWKSKKTKYYTFTSIYFVKKSYHGLKGYWNYESHAIDAKTGHMYHYKSIGSAGGK
ncbi:hypothetical protein DA798_11345 [Lactobacillus sp. PFC-70]|nr:hypothetical protein DA798_11345 [Lactobacillus sp. PFC-70]